MVAQHIDAAHGAKPPLPSPSQMWSNWQALKGADFRRLPTPDVDLRDKWVILTGGNSGVGREAALQFVKWGANVILGCRQPPPHEMHPDAAVQEMQAAALAAGHDKTVVEWWECDMSSLNSVETFGQRWLAKGLPLDILANNAGMGGVSEKVCFTSDGFEVVHQVRNKQLFLLLVDSDRFLGELYFPCSTHSDTASIFGTSFTTPDYLHHLMHAIFWNFRPKECQQRPELICQQ
jgi:hypothetical protein